MVSGIEYTDSPIVPVRKNPGSYADAVSLKSGYFAISASAPRIASS